MTATAYFGRNGLDAADADDTDDTDISHCLVSDYMGKDDCSSHPPRYHRKTCKCTVAARGQES